MQIHNQVLEWAVEHVHWPFIVGAAWWLRGQITDFLGKVNDTHLQVSNHIPTALKEQTGLLVSIDKNIAVMASNRRTRVYDDEARQ